MKKIALLGIIIFMGANCFTQAAFTFDLENLLQSVKEYEVMMQQTQMMIQNLKYQYEMTVNQAKQLQQLDYTDIHSFRDAVSMANEGLSFARNTENYLTKQRFKFGNNSYTLSEMYQAPGGGFSTMIVAATKQMSPEEKAAIWSYYGLDPANYYYAKLWKGRVNEIGRQLTAMAVQGEELAVKQMTANEELAKSAQGVDSQVALQQISVELLKNTANALERLGLGTQKIGEQIAAIAELDNYEQAPQKAVSDDFMNSLNQ